MECVDRMKKYQDQPLDVIMLLIRNGTIKSGKYSHLVKIKKDKIIKEKELFKNGN